MTLDRDWLVAVARAERVALGTTIQYTPPERWEAVSPVEGWRVKDVLAHLAATEVAAAAYVGDESPAEVEEFEKSLPEGESFTLDGFNDWSVRRRADVHTVSLAQEWGRAADLLLARVAKSSPEEWREKVIDWLMGEIRLGYLVQLRVTEWWIHGEDVRFGAGLPPRKEHPPIHSVNDLGIRMLPYWLARAGKSFPRKSVKVGLDGAGGGSWHYGLEAGYRPPQGRKPDVTIGGRGDAFATLVARRADPDVLLYEGLVNYGGDPEIAEAILQEIRISG